MDIKLTNKEIELLKSLAYYRISEIEERLKTKEMIGHEFLFEEYKNEIVQLKKMLSKLTEIWVANL